MNDLAKTELFSLLSESSQVTKQEIKNAYATFLTQVETLQSETDFQKVFRILNFTHIEFKALRTQILCEQGKKCT